MRSTVSRGPRNRLTAAAAALLAAGLVVSASSWGPSSWGPSSLGLAAAHASECNDAFCTPGIASGVVLGAPCSNTGFYVFGTTDWGRLVFCGSPRRYDPRYFRSPPMVGVKDLDSSCTGNENYVAQAPDGLFLTCSFVNNRAVWVRGDA